MFKWDVLKEREEGEKGGRREKGEGERKKGRKRAMIIRPRNKKLVYLSVTQFKQHSFSKGWLSENWNLIPPLFRPAPFLPAKQVFVPWKVAGTWLNEVDWSLFLSESFQNKVKLKQTKLQVPKNKENGRVEQIRDESRCTFKY